MNAKRQDARDEVMWRDWQLERDGLLDPDQPTETAHRAYRAHLFAEFTPMDRAMIRSSLGMVKADD